MPYIDPRLRDLLTPESEALPGSPGELNFVITRVIDDYLKFTGITYINLNSVIGVLECAKLELYARIARPYEDEKIAENGDVYTCNKERN